MSNHRLRNLNELTRSTGISKLQRIGNDYSIKIHNSRTHCLHFQCNINMTFLRKNRNFLAKYSYSAIQYTINSGWITTANEDKLLRRFLEAWANGTESWLQSCMPIKLWHTWTSILIRSVNPDSRYRSLNIR